MAAGGALLPEVPWALPPSDSYDLRNDNNKNYITAIKDQEDPVPCNACTAFAVAAAVEGTSNKMNNQFGSPTSPPVGPNLDEMELFLRAPDPADPNDAASGGCGTSHWWPKNALARCKSKGIKVEGLSPAQYVKILDTKYLLSEDPNLTKPEAKFRKDPNGYEIMDPQKVPSVAVMVQYQDLYMGKSSERTTPDMPNPQVYAPGRPLSVCDPVRSGGRVHQPARTQLAAEASSRAHCRRSCRCHRGL